MANWHMISVPARFTECERYGNAVIAIYEGRYTGFAQRYDTRTYGTRAECRKAIDAAIAEKL